MGMVNTGTDGGSYDYHTSANHKSDRIYMDSVAANGPTGTTACFDSTPELVVLMHGTVNVGASGGVIKVQGIKVTSSTFTVRIGSWLRVTQRK